MPEARRSDVTVMRIVFVVLAFLNLVVSCGAGDFPHGGAQPPLNRFALPVPPNMPDGFRIKSVVQEVKLSFTVTDQSGRPKLDLRKEDFRILDQDNPAEHIQSFAMEHDLPLRVVFLIDGSSSLAKWFPEERDGVSQFVTKLRPGTDAAATVIFADAQRFESRFQNSSPDLIRNVDIRHSENITALYDVVHRACSALGRIEEAGLVRRAIIVISDGGDNASMYGPQQVVEQAQRNEVALYTIAMGQSRSADAQMLARLSTETGAQSYAPKTPQELQSALTSIETELRSQYSLTFRPPGPVRPGTFHAVKVSVPGADRYSVRVRAGYYVPDPQ
jgi:Ca-activated chloride channel homolog